MADPIISSILTPSLIYDDAQTALKWLSDVLGFTVASKYEMPDGHIAFAELYWRTAVIFVSDRPPKENPWNRVGIFSIALAAEDAATVDQYYARAVKQGADIVRPVHDSFTPAFPEGSHQFDVRDPGGNLWTVGTFQPRIKV
jgi:uncharacterized glyoxalase superfamily protein PhnB